MSELVQIPKGHPVEKLNYIRANLKRGDQSLIAEKLDVSPVLVSNVVNNNATSNKVFNALYELVVSRSNT